MTVVIVAIAVIVCTAGAASSTMKCFVAGTMVLTATGLVAIENIKAGDRVISTNTETFETAEKTVLETYIRETTELVCLTINGELIKTTYDHPFYVKGHGFVSAGQLYIGDKLLDSNGNTLIVEDEKVETLDEAVKVYNFQVEDFHTYYVGDSSILVHNACGDIRAQKYGEGWSDESLAETVDDIAPGSQPTRTTTGKEIYNNPQTGKQVVYDVDGNYFRIEDTNISGNRRYTDINGTPIPNNTTLPNGKQIGLSRSDYN